MENSAGYIVGHLPGPLRVLHGTAVIVTDVLGITGNLLVIILIVTTSKLRTSHNAFVCNHSLVNLLLSIVFLPFYAVAVLAGKWPEALDPILCRFSAHFSALLWHVSLINHCALAINRYLLVGKSPAVYDKYCGRKPIAFVLLSTWFLAVAVAVIFHVKFESQYQPLFSFCITNVDPGSRLIVTVISSITVVTGMIVIPVQYYRIFRVVQASGRQFLRPTAMVPVALAETALPRRGPHPRSSASRSVTKEEIRLIKMSVIVTLVYLLSYVPISVISVIGMYNPVVFRGARLGVFILSLTPAVDPVIYAWMNRNIRKACCRVIRCQQLAHAARRR
ncbi:alpha-1D adrenergic receptor-like [Acanthaster planci]|uniref:Alpha-1D adrenergic receptor-like n=1 Tax=Acanthaster planci TaxID=133434 RepID=A0A8B7Y8P5_ACAPL|nr:alpha-1D adrenergic receptor-like [Acanthaster planci]